MNLDTEYEIYQIGDAKNHYTITLAPYNAIYDGANSYRKAHRLALNHN